MFSTRYTSTFLLQRLLTLLASLPHVELGVLSRAGRRRLRIHSVVVCLCLSTHEIFPPHLVLLCSISWAAELQWWAKNRVPLRWLYWEEEAVVLLFTHAFNSCGLPHKHICGAAVFPLSSWKFYTNNNNNSVNRCSFRYHDMHVSRFTQPVTKVLPNNMGFISIIQYFHFPIIPLRNRHALY